MSFLQYYKDNGLTALGRVKKNTVVLFGNSGTQSNFNNTASVKSLQCLVILERMTIDAAVYK